MTDGNILWAEYNNDGNFKNMENGICFTKWKPLLKVTLFKFAGSKIISMGWNDETVNLVRWKLM